MLVLSRRQNQDFCFPNLGINISVLRVAGKVVRLGIDAPKDIRVLREELTDSHDQAQQPAPRMAGEPTMTRQERHDFRDRLNSATLGLQVLQQRLEHGETDDLESLIYRIFSSLQDLNTQIDAQKDRQTAPAETRQPSALVVEDNANEGQLLAEFLRCSGYHTKLVSNGREAIEYLKQHERPDIVLMDMNMPDMNGQETVCSIRKEPELSGLRLYGVSGLESEEAGVAIGEEGVNRWFTKPVDARRLVQELNQELEQLVSA